MTSAGAYRPARGALEAIAELLRHSGTHFDPASVDALIAALPVKMAGQSVLEEALHPELV